MEALVGVVVGAVLAAAFGAWRDHQQRQHQLRAELRAQRFAAVADLTAAADGLWRRHTDVVLAIDKFRDAREQAQDEELQESMDEADRAAVTFHSADQEAAVTLSRLRLVCPALRDEAEALVEICRRYDYLNSDKAEIRAAQERLEAAARIVLSIDDD